MIWLDALNAALKRGKACVVVTVSHVAGSAPRTVGTKMVVTRLNYRLLNVPEPCWQMPVQMPL